MSDNTNLVLEHLRAIRAGQEGMRDDIREIKGRLAILEIGYGSISSRLDRMEGRLDRIEQRLGLVEAEA